MLLALDKLPVTVRGEEGWLAVRPPLRAAGIGTGTMLLDEFRKAGLTL